MTSKLLIKVLRIQPHVNILRNFSSTTFKSSAWHGNSLNLDSILIFNSIPKFREWRRKKYLENHSVGLVPTMGALHDGHLSLVRMAARENTAVVVSIYVNPTQFSPNEDFDSYPKTLERDINTLKNIDLELANYGANIGRVIAIFAPKTTEMYPSGCYRQKNNEIGTFVTVMPQGGLLEGASRPLFFKGVATICTKLFNIVTPERVYFGQKDIQQTVVIKKMVRDLCIDTQVVVGETKRAADGLALSSRNVFLGTRRRKIATVLYSSLRFAEQQYKKGFRNRDDILQPALTFLGLIHEEQEQNGKMGVHFALDYISLADPETLEEVQEVDQIKGAILSGAIKMLPVDNPQPDENLGWSNGPMVRLLDNIILYPIKK